MKLREIIESYEDLPDEDEFEMGVLERLNRDRQALVGYLRYPRFGNIRFGSNDSFHFGPVEELRRSAEWFKQQQDAGRLKTAEFEINAAGHFADTIDWDRYVEPPTIVNCDISESYEDLHDEDEFVTNYACDLCGVPEENLLYCGGINCDQAYCAQCVQRNDMVWEIDEENNREILVQCPACRPKTWYHLTDL